MIRLSRRNLLASAAATGIAGAVAADDNTQPSVRRKFTVCLAPGMVGVPDDPTSAIERAARFGFESIEPSPQFISKLSDAQLQDYLGRMREAKLVWGATGLPVQFRGDDAAFERDLKALPDRAASLQRAGRREWALGSPRPLRR
jgi:hypothetical protein